MTKIKRFIECLIPVTACNLRCEYCYVIQRQNRKGEMARLKYSPEVIGKALSKKRWGGICYFSICGAGETTIQRGLENIVAEILNQGHFVNITTNGTLKNRLEKIINAAGENVTRLHFAFSLHYNELKKKNLLDVFFENINYVKKRGASIVVQINLCDEYIPVLDDIKKICLKRVGAYPQVAATRKEEDHLDKIELLTALSKEKYLELGKQFESPLFDFTMNNFNVKRHEFCYAGDWSGTLDLSTGILRRCYGSYIYQNIFKNPEKPIRFLAMGCKCPSPFCMNSSHFMSLGVIPEINTPSYADLRNRTEANWYNEEVLDFLNTKLNESNREYSFLKKFLSNTVGCCDNIIRTVYRGLKYKFKKNYTE